MIYQQNQHFSHHHILNPLNLDEGEKIICDACEQDITDPFHGCIKCKYYLHDNCFNTPRSLDHPSHPFHPLTLHQSPTYSFQSYTCNACGSDGSCFSLSCAQCEFDLHLQCANMPSSVLTNKHPHELKLFFGSPYSDKNTVFGCDICSAKMDPHQWLYYCAECDFGTHLDCVKGKPRPVKEKAKTGKGKPKKAEADKRAGSSHAHQRYYNSGVEDLKAVNDAQDALAASHIGAMIDARSRQNMLDLI